MYVARKQMWGIVIL